ncbi:uncharacterized protein FOMMEDRAFT_141652 [Fomitiporia mediterranea MF3/22]|uniref:uncharacterized protein n=1 Tax=Fomitiporia mediterranea (strain MF3/22) TaxID=694068 RepID=UPI00044096B6|nr:uncharacterized protein FOMMEDRAFT_141652 [Fomitiporia mediterranea MF3/22]EJD00878.1 hypothetical protein FOMMEDRAFT_141652 [Fomitiporia mediterranea MF3/22]
MENKVLPAVRVPTVSASDGGDGGGVTETPIVDLPPSEKFGFAYPDQPMIAPILSASAPDPESSEPETSEAESQGSSNTPPMAGMRDPADHTPANETPDSNPTPVPSPSPPRLSRAFSMPLPSQLGHLKNPHRTPPQEQYLVPPSPLVLAQSPNSHLQELSVELADSVQMVIQTLLQISPPHLLDPAKEQFAACSLSVPSPSISAMLTAMKSLNYISANMSTLADDLKMQPELSSHGRESPPLLSPAQDDFDTGEMLQSVGDALSGIAAEAGVELVLFHADVGMKHVSVRGDECGISYVLAHMVRQILDASKPGDTIEVGLQVKPEVGDSREGSQGPSGSEGGSRSSSRASSLPGYDGPLRCTFEVGHKFGLSDAIHAMENNPQITAGTSLFRARPRLDTLLFRRVLHRVGGTVKEDLQPRLFSPGRSCELSIVLEPGSEDILSQSPKLSAEELSMRQPYASMNIQLASEPTLEELNQFVEQLKGKKVALHASARGSFAHHLTSYLTAWGLDVSHMTMTASEDDLSDIVSAGTAVSSDDGRHRISPTVKMTDSPVPIEVNPVEEQLREKSTNESAAFVIIDDDVGALRNRLVQMRSEAPFNLSLTQRPKLSAHHRPKSSPQIFRTKVVKPTFSPQQSAFHPVIIHFTSLQNYRLVKDVIHTILSTPNPSNFIPEIIVLPKPAGPRRVLTALRTAVVKPIVDPFFSPIATSPMSPTGQGINPFSPFGPGSSPSQKSSRPPISPRTASDRSSRSSKDLVEHVPRLPPSPLRESDSLEYFSEAAEKLGTSPSSGLVIQSPDGQPAGIFFHPRGAGSRFQRTDTGATLVNPPNLVRDSGNLRPPGEVRRSILQRRGTSQVHEGDMSPGERPKPFSRPKAPARNRSGLAYFGDIGGTTPSEVNMPDSPGQHWVRTLDELAPPPEITSTAPTPPVGTSLGDDRPSTQPSPSIASDRKSMSLPTSPASNRTVSPPSAGTKRSYSRRGPADSPGTSGTPVPRKGKTSDGNIVPPVNVLIVEDNPINQTILSTFMRKKKIKYDVAKNGAEAVAKWKTGGFHLILMDIQMPVMDGIEATKEIRRLERQVLGNTFASTPPLDGEQTPSDAASTDSKLSMHTPFRSSVIIVALTASSLQTDRVAALAAGCNDFLTKPVSLLWLNNKIIEWGSIKALQMWADLRPEVMKNISSGQVNQAKNVASKLHVPEHRRTHSPPLVKQTPKGTKIRV